MRERAAAPGRSAVVAAVLVIGGWLSPGLPAAERTPTVHTDIGVWYEPDAERRDRLWKPGDGGQPLFLSGRVLDVHGNPVAGAIVEMWHADKDGFIESGKFRATLETDASGAFKVTTVLPGYIWGPRHIHFVVTHPGFPRLITRIFFQRDPVVAKYKYRAVMVALEDGLTGETPALFGSFEFVLAPP